MGAGIALQCAAADPRIEAVVAEAPCATVPFNDAAVLKMPETRHEKRPRDAGRSPADFVEVPAANQ
jgi:hypothetical protein